MPSNAFNASNPTKKAPAYCWHRDPPLPIFFPPIGPARLQGYARWTDLAPIPGPTDIAIYTAMDRVGSSWNWAGHVQKMGWTLYITLARLVDPQPWSVDLLIWYPWGGFEHMIWRPVTMQLEPEWDTGALEHISFPGLDFRQARVQQ